MLVRVSDNQLVNTDHVVNIAQPNANQPDAFTISLSNARQVNTDAEGLRLLEEAMAPRRFTPSDPVAVGGIGEPTCKQASSPVNDSQDVGV